MEVRGLRRESLACISDLPSSSSSSVSIGVHLWLILFLFFIGGCSTARKPETPTGLHFSVLTYNVNFGGPRPDPAIDAIRRADADVVCLQETTPAWEDLIRAELADVYPYISFHTGPVASGMGMLSK